MKRIITLLLAATLVLGAVGAANAIDVKVRGTWDFAFLWTDGTTGGGQARRSSGDWQDDKFTGAQRLRTQINFIASEQLQGVLMFEIGTIYWGRGGTSGQGAGGALDADGVNVETKRAFLDWMVPGTDLAVRMGIQALNLPMANGYSNPVFSADVAGVVANYKFNDMFAATIFWARPFDAGWNDGGERLYDEMDMFGLMVPITGEGWSLTPWGAYASVGSASGLLDYQLGYSGRNVYNGYDMALDPNASNNRADAWWAGGSFEMTMFDPLTFGADVMYGSMSRLDSGFGYMDTSATPTYMPLPGLDNGYKTSGWFVAGALNYQMDWGTPGLFGWWSTGDDYDDVTNDGKFGRIPVVGVDDGFGPTSFGWPGSQGPIGDSAMGVTAVGTWGVGAQIADLTFVEDLSHTVRFAYYTGTNDKEFAKYWGDGLKMSAENVYLVDGDNVYEVNFDSKYQIYENLATYLELGYIHLDLKEYDTATEDRGSSNAWKAQVLFKYAF